MDWVTTEGDYERVVAIDFETTGLDKEDRIVQVGAVAADGDGILERWSCMVNPQGQLLHPKAADVNGLDDERLAQVSLKFADVEQHLRDMTEGALVLAHRLPFDAGFWARECERIGVRPPQRAGICTKILAWKLTLNTTSSLRPAMEYLEVDDSYLDVHAHDAQDDAEMCLRLFRKMQAKFGDKAMQFIHKSICLDKTKLAQAVPHVSAEDVAVYRRAAEGAHSERVLTDV